MNHVYLHLYPWEAMQHTEHRCDSCKNITASKTTEHRTKNILAAA